MIKQNQRIEMATMEYKAQFKRCFAKYHNANLYVVTIDLEEMYVDSYNSRQIVKMKCDEIITARLNNDKRQSVFSKNNNI